VPTEIFSEEIERAVLSALWLYGEKREPFIMKLIPRLFDKLFFIPAHKEVFSAIRELYPDRIDLLSISFRVHRSIPAYKVTEILNAENASLAQLNNYVNYLKTLTFRRYAQTLGQDIQIAAAQDDVNTIMSKTRGITRIYDALHYRESEDFFLKAIESTGNDFIPTAFKALNAHLGGFSRKEISSIGGKSGHQKTAWCIDNSLSLIKSNIVNKIHYVSAEHPGDIIATRVIAREFNIPYHDIILKRVTLDKKECYSTLKRAYGQRFLITDTAFTIRQVIDAIRSNPADQHIIDHIQELSYVNNDMVHGISELLIELKQPAREQNANILVISQVKDKDINDRPDSKIPRSSDFYNSSRVRQESRQQLVIYWKYCDTFEFDPQDTKELEEQFHSALIVVCKSTYGKLGRVQFRISPEVGAFRE